VQTDISQNISIRVKASNCDGSVNSTPTEAVSKAPQTAPEAPTLASSAETSITLNTVSGCEYNINSGEWQTSPIFEGLEPVTSYTFTQRKIETETHLASPTSPTADFSTPLSITESLLGDIKVYPNPTSGELRIESGELRVLGVEIFDVFGRLVGAYPCGRPDTVINILHLQGGFYFVRIQTEAGEVIRKVVKE
jgi:hypothetical protein